MDNDNLINDGKTPTEESGSEPVSTGDAFASEPTLDTSATSEIFTGTSTPDAPETSGVFADASTPDIPEASGVFADASTPDVTPVAEVSPVTEDSAQAASILGQTAKPEKSKGGILVIVALLIVIIAIAAVITTWIIAYDNGKKDGEVSCANSGKDGKTEPKKPTEPTEPDSPSTVVPSTPSTPSTPSSPGSGGTSASDVEADNVRVADLLGFILAINDYQLNNNDKVPFGPNATAASLATFVKRYIDDTCDFINNTIVCDEDSDYFRDPSGDVYGVVNAGEVSTNTLDVTSKVTKYGTFYGFYNAACGDSENIVKKGSGLNDVAIFIRMKTGGFACLDNS